MESSPAQAPIAAPDPAEARYIPAVKVTGLVSRTTAPRIPAPQEAPAS